MSKKMMHIIKGNKITTKNEGFKLLAMTYCQRFSSIVTGNDHFLNVQSFTGGVICPFIGDTVARSDFEGAGASLPASMNLDAKNCINERTKERFRLPPSRCPQRVAIQDVFELNNNTTFNFKQWKSFWDECSIALENIRSGHIQHIFQMKEKRAEKAKVDLEEKKKKKNRATKAKRQMSDDEYYQCALVTLFHAKILRLCNLFIHYVFHLCSGGRLQLVSRTSRNPGPGMG